MRTIVSLALTVNLIVLLIGCTPAEVPDAEEPQKMSEIPAESGAPATAEPEPDMIESAGIDERRGVRVNEPDTLDGYILFTPMLSAVTYLINRDGQVVHTWTSEYAPGNEYLLDDGHLMRSARDPHAPRFNGGGQAGIIEKFTFDGDRVWSYSLADLDHLLHHDFAVMPNGNILAIAWEGKTAEEAKAAGRNPEQIPEAGMWPDMIIEIKPDATGGGDIVWEWHAWDHLIQNQDPALPNYGEPRGFPRRIDINADGELPEVTAEELAHAKATNQAPGTATLEDRGSDMHHSNAIFYNAELDQIAVSVRELSEIWIIDHAISTEEARGPAGDLLYRWGNPETYGHESADGTGLGYQHDIRWIPEGFPGAGNLMAFSNTVRGAAPPYSEVVEFTPPRNQDGRYELEDGVPFGPGEPVWTFSDGFFSPFISGAQRLANGNTLVNFGPQGRIVEATPEGDIVWEYWSPYSGEVRLPDGSHPQPGAPFMYAAFRATFVPVDHPALRGRTLEPLDPQPAPSVLREDELAPFRGQAAEAAH
jgi:hypothetical protein